jgi:hypothetical protein
MRWSVNLPGRPLVQEPDLLAIFGRPLHSAGMRYLVAGSLGSMLYSEPRLTIDVDFAVALADADLAALSRLFQLSSFTRRRWRYSRRKTRGSAALILTSSTSRPG